MKQFFFLLLLIPTISFSQGKLKKTKQSLNQNTTTVSTSNSSTTRTSRRRTTKRKTRRNTRVFDSFFAELAFYATAGIVVGQAQERDLNPYPYFYDNEGEYAAELSNTGVKQNLRVSSNFLFNNVNAIELNALYKPLPILGIEASHLHFSEKNRQNTAFLDVTSLLINYYRIRDKNFSLWWGIGATYVGNEVDKLGFAYTLGTEIYPVKPISLHLSWKESFINDNEIGVFKSDLKYHFKKTAVFTGYHNFELGSETISGFVLGVEYTF